LAAKKELGEQKWKAADLRKDFRNSFADGGKWRNGIKNSTMVPTG